MVRRWRERGARAREGTRGSGGGTVSCGKVAAAAAAHGVNCLSSSFHSAPSHSSADDSTCVGRCPLTSSPGGPKRRYLERHEGMPDRHSHRRARGCRCQREKPPHRAAGGT